VSVEASVVTETIDGIEVENRDGVGPRAIDAERPLTLAVDSLQFTDAEILVSVRVINDGDAEVALGAGDPVYGPLLWLHAVRVDDYPTRAVEPAGVYEHSVGYLDLRLDGAIDPEATTFTVALATDHGPLKTGPEAIPRSDAVRWRPEAPTTTGSPAFADLPHLPELIHALITNESETRNVYGPPDVGDAG